MDLDLEAVSFVARCEAGLFLLVRFLTDMGLRRSFEVFAFFGIAASDESLDESVMRPNSMLT